jgi:2-polyprenyl-3-methyl-5-hydroxy-6-metoxy-1,4-benzoquinol methylase
METDATKQMLVDFSNKRGDNKFANYDDYIDYQKKKGFSYEKYNQKWADGQRQCVQQKFCNLNRNLRILDICCGDGRGLQQFKEMGFIDVNGVEISDEKISFAKEFGYNIFKQDICCGSFNFGEKYDIIYSSHTIEHVLNPEYTIKNIMNSLKDDGTFFLILPYPDVEASNPLDDHRFKIHCGVIPLGLHMEDNGNTTCDVIKNMGFKVANVTFDNYREPEIHLTIKK